MGLQRGHKGGGFWLMKCYAMLQHFLDLLFGNIFRFLMSTNKILHSAASHKL